MFPLNTVVFPGVTTGLHVFEERYRALVRHLLTIEDPADRVFGVTAIREGYEVGDSGAQSLHTLGTLVQVVAVEALPDGRFNIEVFGRQRLRLLSMDPPGEFPAGIVDLLPGEDGETPLEAALIATRTFDDYRTMLSQMGLRPSLPVGVPRDPEWLSWTMAESASLTLAQRQELLATETAEERLYVLTIYLREEIRAMRAVPSLPATDVARTRWSPN